MTASSPAGGHSPEIRRLRRQLATLLSAIADLRQEWDATLELAEHLRAQRLRAGQPATTTAVAADLEAILRASTALPDRNTPLTTPEQLVPAIAKAQQTYDNLIAQHVTHARDYLDSNRP